MGFVRTLSALALASSLLAQKNVTGEWAPLVNWPFVPIAIGHTVDGRIVGWASTRTTSFPAGETYTHAALYDPATGTFTNLPNVKHDMFCAGMASTADGRIVASGGGADVRTTSFLGMTSRWGQNWVQAGNMNQGRWYNTSLMLPDKRILTWWGRAANGVAEIFNPDTGVWTAAPNLNAASTADPNDGVDDENQWFPHLHVAPDGRVFQAGPLKTLRWLDWTGAGSTVTAGFRTPDGDRHRKLGFSVMYRPGKLLFTGGRDDRYTPKVTNTTVLIDINGANPISTAGPNMNYARVFHYGVMLPNGELFVAGGNTSGIKFSDSGGVTVAEMWNPDTNAWRTLPAMAVARGYHTVGILLRDGRVLIGGGGLCACAADHPNSQLYSPGYLFNSDGSAATRPTISNTTFELKAGQTVSLTGSDDITAFNMIRLQGTTHGLNSDQRFLPIPFTKTGTGQYSLTLHANANVLLPGHYWIFALTAQGTPSIGYPVQVFTATDWPGAGNAAVNLSRGKTATQSSTFETAAAARAVDGNQNGAYDLRSVSHTNSDGQAWWQVDLGAIANIRQIQLWNRTDCCGDRLSNFHVFVSDTPFASTVLSATRTQPGVTDLAFPGVASSTALFNVNRTGRYVRVQLEGTGHLQLAEVEVLGTLLPNRAPTATLTAPAANATFTAPASISLTADASDPDNNLARVEFYQGTTKLGEDSTAPYSFAWNNVAEGSYSLTARAIDTAGLTTTSAAVSITVNPANRAPTVSLTAPAANASFTAPATITITANATDPDNNLARVEFYRGAVKLGETTAAPYSFTWNNVAQGAYSLTARAIDAANLTTTSAAVNITVNANSAPTVALTAPANNATFTAPASITISANAADTNNNLARVEFYQGATKLGEDTTAPFSFTWSNVAQGAYSLTARAIDTANLSTTSAAINITVNAGNRAPTVSLTAPLSGATFTTPASITLTANASDPDNNLARVEFYAGATKLGEDTTAPFSFTWTGVGVGTYALTARAVDAAGLAATSAAASVTVGAANSAPTVSLTAPAANATFTAPANITLTANATDADNNLARVEFYQGATKLGEDTTAPYSFTWSNVSAGAYSLTARAIDTANLSATSAAVNITVTGSASTGLAADYYDGATFNTLRFSRTDPTIDFNWGSAGPGNGLSASAYSVRWQGKVEAPATTDLVLCASSDDGMRINIDGANIADNYYAHTGTTTSCGSFAVTAGAKYDISIDYFNQGATAVAQLRWWYNGGAFEVVPTRYLTPRGATAGAPPSVTITAPAAGAAFTAPASITIAANATDPDNNLARVEFFNGATKLGEDTTAPYSFTWTNVPAGAYTIDVRATDTTSLTAQASVAVTVNPPGGAGNGLKGDYFTNLDFTGLAFTRTDAVIDLDWGSASPGGSLPANRFAVRWSGQIQAPTTEEYVFCAGSDDGIRVRINGAVIVDNYYDHAFQTSCGTVNMTAGQKVAITVDYYNNGAPGAAKLQWWYPSGNFEVVPTSRLFPQ